MTNPTLEKVARAIMLARDNGGCIVKDWAAEERDNPHVAQALRQARAALQSLRQVDDETLRAMYEALPSDDPQGPDDLAKAFTAAIDHILTEGGEG